MPYLLGVGEGKEPGVPCVPLIVPSPARQRDQDQKQSPTPETFSAPREKAFSAGITGDTVGF